MWLPRTWTPGFAALRRVRVRPIPPLAAVLALVGLLAPLAAGTASAVELLDGELVAAGSPVLQNASGTLRLEQGRLDGLGRKVFVIPEPGGLWQLGPGLALLALLHRRRARRSRHSEKEGAVMKKHFRSRVSWLATLALILLAAPAFAQVPQDMTYTGRLVDSLGDPLAGPVNLELRIFDAETGPTQLYSEEHLSVALDATGGFSVQLGLGTSPSGTFDAALFSDVDRWLEVEVDGEVLTPRQILGSVPWALIAEQANKLVPDPGAARFEDCGDGTVADHRWGLRWEKKTGDPLGSSVICETEGCPDPHDVNNAYQYSDTGTEPDGDAFTDFLARLNGKFDPDAATGCFADRCDWRLPEISEFQTILIGAEAAPGQDPICPAAPCIDTGFAAVGGPTKITPYRSATTWSGNPIASWVALFNLGLVQFNDKMAVHTVRAVRTGSCH